MTARHLIGLCCKAFGVPRWKARARTRLQGDASNPLALKIEVSYRKPELAAIEHQPNLMIE